MISTMTYFALATFDSKWDYFVILFEMAINMPILFLQILLLAGAALQFVFLVIVLQELFVLCMLFFTQISNTYGIFWFSFGLLYWFGIVMVLVVPVLSQTVNQSDRVKKVYSNVITWIIFTGVMNFNQVLYPINLFLFRHGETGSFVFFLAQGILDFLTRIGVGAFLTYNYDAFGIVSVLLSNDNAEPEREPLLHGARA